MSEIDYTQLYIQAELETIAQKTEDILADPDGYECSACCIEGQPCDVGLAVKVERDRIIKLLGQQACVYGEHCADGECSFHETLNHAIALIKGEK